MQDYIYSIIAFLAVVIHLIINFDLIPGRKVYNMHSVREYRFFLAGVFVYYLTDAAWGVLAGLGWTRLLYFDTMANFIAIAVSVLALCHFVIAYLCVKGLKARVLFWFGYALLALYFVLLVVNVFNNCLFYFDEQGRYCTGFFRYFLFYPLVAFILLIAFFSFARVLRSQDSVRRRNMVVFLFCLTMAVAVVFQIIFPLWPFFAMGCLVGNCFFHVFVIEDERAEQRQAVIKHEQTMKHIAELEEVLERTRAAEKAMKEYSEAIEKQREQEVELRKQLEDALLSAQDADREKSAALKDLEDASELARLASFHYDFDTRIRTGSNLLCELWPTDENGRALLEEEFVYPEDLPFFKENMRALFEKKAEKNATVQFSFRIGKDASNLRHYRMKLTLDPRKANALTGIVQDVTELAISMMKLKDTQALWDAAINSIPIMFTVKDIDDDFRYLLCNKAFASVFNFSPDEIVGKTDHDIFHDDHILGFADQINSTTTGTDGLMEIAGEVADGSGNLRFIKTLMRVFEDTRGHRLLLAAASDVTDMHRLIENQKLVNSLLEDIIGEEDFDLCIRRTLENVCKILGASRGCLIRHEEEGAKAHFVYEYVEPTHSHASFRLLGRTFNRVQNVLDHSDDRRTFVCNDMSTFDWSIVKEEWHQAALALDLRAIFLSNIICEGKVRGNVVFDFEGVDHTFTDNDISLLSATAHMIEVVLARKHAQALIMDALNRAQAADKAKSFFVASVSHEIRTPLNSVIGFAELLREGGVSKDQEKEYLDAISSSANALLMLINDVLDLSKLEANQMRIITAFTDFNALCREVLLIFTFRARENGNKLVSDVPDDLPELDVDNIRIRQILINLLGNAVKFTKKGEITLHVTFTPDSDSADTGTLRCAVSDTGIGISEEDQKKLMEPFVQLSNLRGTNAVNNGTGLGLSISKRLAACMNGELTCTSRMGEGSTFAVTLNSVRYRAKAARAQDKSKPEAEAVARDLKALRILIVDDVPMNLRVAKALFGKIGFDNVFTAVSGREALEILDKQPVDLVLSDMWMPEMNGTELSAEIRKNPKFAHITVVAQTADVETSGNFDMSHFDAIILKPITKEKLSNMVKRIFEDGEMGKGGGPVNLG